MAPVSGVGNCTEYTYDIPAFRPGELCSGHVNPSLHTKAVNVLEEGGAAKREHCLLVRT